MAAGIELTGLTKRFGHGVTSHAAVDNIDLPAASQRRCAVYGSACGVARWRVRLRGACVSPWT